MPLLTAQDVLQLPAEQVVVFHRDRPPARAERADWRSVAGLGARVGLAVPAVPSLAAAPGLPELDTDSEQAASLQSVSTDTARRENPRERNNRYQPELDLFDS